MNSDIVRILLVENNAADARLIREYFAADLETHFLITTVGHIAEAIDMIDQQRFNIILLELELPDSHGLETLRRMHTHVPHLPIIVLTGINDDSMALTAMRQGAQDYLLKGKFDYQLLNRAIRYTIERKQAELEIKKLAYYDTLTGLPNRILFSDRLRQAITLAMRDKHSVGLLFIDLDNFKNVNDSLGHAYGDRLLKITADRIHSCLRNSDTVARLGGDEFVVMIPTISSGEIISKVTEKILDILRLPVQLEEYEIYSSASIGVALFPDDGTSVEELLKSADIAMYQAKEHGRANVQFFSKAMNEKALNRQFIETSLRQALTRQEFFLEYQPQFDINSREIIGFEALIRWRHPTNGITAPDLFIPIAEETGLIIPIGDWVLRTACLQAKSWLDHGYEFIRIAVNISARQFRQDDFVARVREILIETGLPAKHLELELTESAVMDHADHNILVLNELKEIGIKLAIDDFGTGYSSLSYLKYFPIDRLKIDRTFVRDIGTSSDDAAIAEAIIVMAHSLKLSVVAEGVEEEGQFDFFHSRSCDELQGFLMSHPLSVCDATELLTIPIKKTKTRRKLPLCPDNQLKPSNSTCRITKTA